jgi:hypothetical protein
LAVAGLHHRPTGCEGYGRAALGDSPLTGNTAFPLEHEGMLSVNNRIKMIKRMCYRFRDDQYFCLTIRFALPGIR